LSGIRLSSLEVEDYLSAVRVLDETSQRLRDI